MCRISNPLAGIPKEQLVLQVEEFAQEKGLTDVLPLLVKGALVAQDPSNSINVEGIDESERDAINNETLHRWRQPKSLYLTVIVCSIGAAVQ